MTKTFRAISLLILALCLSSVTRAASNITVPQKGSAAAASATITSTGFGDVIVVCANRASNTEPTVATGYTTIKHATGANTQSGTCGYKVSTGGDTSTGSWTNAANVSYAVVRGYRWGSVGVIGLNPAQSNGTSTSLTYPTGIMTSTDGSSVLFTFGTATGATTTPPDTCPTGPGTMTLASNTAQNSLALCYLIGATSAATINSVTIAPSTGHCGFTFEIIGTEPFSDVNNNYLVDSIYTTISGEPCTGVCNFTITYPPKSGSRANNELVLYVAWGYATTAPTISNVYCNADTGHATWTWTSIQALTSTGDTSDMSAYHIDGAAAGCTSVTVVFSSVYNNVWGWLSEWRQIATSSALDAHAGQVSTATPPYATSGSYTPVSNGDVIIHACDPAFFWEAGLGTNPFWGDYGTSFPASDSTFQIGADAFVQTTAAAISPYLNLTGNTLDALCIGIALKTSNGAGTNVSGAQVVQQTETTKASQATTNIELQVLHTGDTVFVYGTSGNVPGTTQACTGITDTSDHSWTIKQLAGGANAVPMVAFDSNSIEGITYITLTGCATGGNQNWVAGEITGTNNTSHTSSYDATMGFCNNQNTTTPYSSAPGTCTPSTSNGVMLAFIGIGTGPFTGISSPACGTFNYPTYTGMTDISFMTEGGGFSICYNTNTSGQTWTWTGDPNTAAWGASAVAFEAPPSGAAFIPPAVY